MVDRKDRQGRMVSDYMAKPWVLISNHSRLEIVV